MSTEPESFLARWSRRKREAERTAEAPAEGVRPEAPAPAAIAGESKVTADVASGAPPSGAAPPTEVVLPSIESLDGLRSDYQAFFQQPVSDELRRAALRKLFADPHFNQMDMLDVYVDDYTQFEPLPADLRLRLSSARDFLSDSERAAQEAADFGRSSPVPPLMDSDAAPGTDADTLSASTASSSPESNAAPAISARADDVAKDGDEPLSSTRTSGDPLASDSTSA